MLFQSAFSYSTQQQQTMSLSGCEVRWKVDSIKQPVMTSSVAGLRRCSKALPKLKLAPKRGPCSVICCWLDPLQLFFFFLCLLLYCIFVKLQLFESQWNHYVWEVCSANWWDALKTMSVVGTGQQNGSNPPQHRTASSPTNALKVEWIELQSFASTAIFTWPLTNWPAL